MAAIEMTRPVANRPLARLMERLVAWNEARATRVALSRLSDRELEDIGLERGDISTIAYSR
ncbi:DUF1127 domain-containing protein [Roseovarius sp. C7]|uniref:DUF1127 domain-containing protein n=1 Tax=Roseovarius sp. C7 TaxID=3398643 RepID=UPI0039F697D4